MVINFEQTEEFKEIQKKWSFSDEELENFFEDLTFENIQYSDTQYILYYHKGEKKDISKSFEVGIRLDFLVKIEEFETLNRTREVYDFNSYFEIISKKKEKLEKIKSYVDRFVKARRLTIERATIDERVSVKKEKFRVSYIFIRKIYSDELYKEEIKWSKKPNYFRETLDKIIKRFVESGIPEKDARKLVEFEDDYEVRDSFLVGFFTNYQIIEIGEFNKNKFEYNEDGFEESLEEYFAGNCSDFL